MNQETIDAFVRLNETLDVVRKECPWDRVQTMGSLRYLTIEETYELSEAILKILSTPNERCEKANNEMKKELGDLFMHLLFYCKIAEEEGRFDTTDVLNAISDKLVDRHPFIFRKEDYHGESWEQIKMHEGRKSVLDGVPTSLPPLVKAVRLQEKAAGIGFQLDEKEMELHEGMTEGQFGQLLFNLIHWAHNRGINADSALSKANLHFQEEVRNFEESKGEKGAKSRNV
jgi:XTP/dITP diphosphohydrolase